MKLDVRDKAGNTVAQPLVDDASPQAEFRWCRHSSGYFKRRREDGRYVLLHREVMGVNPGDPRQVDHINRDKTDNRKCNLRIATPQQNQANKELQRNNTSGVRGVVWHRVFGKWQAQIKVRGRMIYLGRFSDKAAAAEARRRAETKYYGERCPTHA